MGKRGRARFWAETEQVSRTTASDGMKPSLFYLKGSFMDLRGTKSFSSTADLATFLVFLPFPTRVESPAMPPGSEQHH